MWRFVELLRSCQDQKIILASRSLLQENHEF
jgi:hypothetical protein